MLPWYYSIHGRPQYSRPRTFDLPTFTSQFSTWRAAAGGLPIAGPSFANLPWMAGLPGFLSSEPGLGMVTFHRYPLRGCHVQPSQPSYATISNMLSDYATTQLTSALAQYAALAHANGLPFRIDEMNSVACSGRRGISDTFASGLWMLDTLFGMRAAGVDGVNVHTLPNAAYELFTFSNDAAGWHAVVHPDYYGMLMFAQADPPGARLLPVSGAGGQVKIWATLGADGKIRVVLINKDLAASHVVVIHVPGNASSASVEQFSAPSADATTGVTLSGQGFGGRTDTGTLPGRPQTGVLQPLAGIYTISLPPAGAEMLTQ
jgi:hypothetical protein